MFRFLLAAVITVAAVSAHAKPSDPPVEASMLVTGTVDIEVDGSVSAHAIDRQDSVPGYVVDTIRRASATWRFEPVLVDGKPVPARAHMTLRLLATPASEDGMLVSVSRATFGQHAPDEAPSLVRKNNQVPAYPTEALMQGAGAMVYLVLRVERDGTVAEAFAEQTNLYKSGNAITMARMRKLFAEATLKAARRWTFSLPTTSENADDPYWVLRMPVEFTVGKPEGDRYGEWIAYAPGPRSSAAWMQDDAGSNDAIPGGSVHLAGKGPRLLTPLQPES